MTIKERISTHDPEGMLKLLNEFGGSFDDALRRAEEFSPELGPVDEVVVCGMGGSALGAELAHSLSSEGLKVPIEIFRDYTVPSWVGPRTLVLAFSYSGSTEETLSATRDALSKKAQVVVATSGGELAALAEHEGLPCFTIPGGLPPRLSIHFFMAVMLRLLTLSGLAEEVHFDAARNQILHAPESYSPEQGDNLALQLARTLQDRTVLFYGAETVDAVTRIWKSQFNENAKQFVHVGQMSELNHNEILSWPNLTKQTKKPVVLLIHSWLDNAHMQKRFEFTAKELKEDGMEVIELRSESRDRPSELFYLIMLGIWTSYYLAILAGRDPMNIDAINNLKSYLK